MRRGWKIAIGMVAALVVLLVLNAVVTSNETKPAEVTEPGGRILSLDGGDIQVVDRGPRDAQPDRADPLLLLRDQLVERDDAAARQGPSRDRGRPARPRRLRKAGFRLLDPRPGRPGRPGAAQARRHARDGGRPLARRRRRGRPGRTVARTRRAAGDHGQPPRPKKAVASAPWQTCRSSRSSARPSGGSSRTSQSGRASRSRSPPDSTFPTNSSRTSRMTYTSYKESHEALDDYTSEESLADRIGRRRNRCW